VHFQNFDVKAFVERLRHPLDERRQQIDAEAHIAGPDHDSARGDALDHGIVGVGQPGGADDMNDATLGSDRNIGDGRARHGEVENAVGVRRQCPQIGRELDAVGGSPASIPASLPKSSDPGASSAPVRTAPFVSEMTRVSARPIRPPAPATINRMSDMAYPSMKPL